ncbi:MAG: hypothetical protein HQL22_05045 [Candidatus Omnitrophica bacterium]|nr:hypothetical protein [Candidatus Omnitrophota bacterium]
MISDRVWGHAARKANTIIVSTKQKQKRYNDVKNADADACFVNKIDYIEKRYEFFLQIDENTNTSAKGINSIPTSHLIETKKET